MSRHKPSLTISDVAAYAGVTVRAVRHYHQRGLLPEPRRDSSGYRRYDATAVVDLIRIKALSQAGVPLARVRELLAANPEEFALGMAQIDQQLREKVRRLEGHRAAISQLSSVDALALPAEVVDYLARLRACGLSERTLSSERDQWLLISAQAPEQIAGWVTTKKAMLDDADFVDVYRSFDQAFDWQPGDHRLDHLAQRMIALAATVRADTTETNFDDNLVALLDAQRLHASPGIRYLAELLQQRQLPEPVES